MSADPPQHVIHTVPGKQRHKDILLAGVCGDGQSIGKEPRHLVFFDQLHRYHRNDHLDILAKEAGMEAKPVGRDIEPTVEKEVSLEGTGTHFENHLLQRDIFKQLVVLLVVFAQ